MGNGLSVDEWVIGTEGSATPRLNREDALDHLDYVLSDRKRLESQRVRSARSGAGSWCSTRSGISGSRVS